MKAEKCPVCYGSGKYPNSVPLDKNQIFNQPSKKPLPEEQSKCHGCDGKGWIALPSDPPYFPPRNINDRIRRQGGNKPDYPRWNLKEWYCNTCRVYHKQGVICSA